MSREADCRLRHAAATPNQPDNDDNDEAEDDDEEDTDREPAVIREPDEDQ